MALCGLCGRTPRKPSLVTFPDSTMEADWPNKTWMGDLIQYETETAHTKATLKRMVVPGSHDSASYSISERKLGSAIGRTQNLSAKEQLLAGVRFFDLRVATGKKEGSSSGVNIFHGRLMGCPLEEVLDEVEDFCQEFPTEFVCLAVQAEYGRPFSPQDKRTTLELLKEQFGKVSDPPSKRLLCKVNLRNELINTPLAELIPTYGRVLVLVRDRFFEDFVVNGVAYNEEFVKKEYGFCDARMWLRDKWHETTSPLELLESNLREIRAHKANKRRYFVNNQFVLTPKFGKGVSLQPVQLANKGLYQPSPNSGGRGIPLLHECFLEHPEEDWNYVSLDFVDLCPTALSLWIGMNFGSLEVELALLGSGGSNSNSGATDVTDLVRSKILRESCLFLHPKHEFDPEALDVPEASLTLVYRISGKLYTIVVGLSDLFSPHVVVLNPHNHLLAGGKELLIGGGTQGNGTIQPFGQSGITVTWQKTENRSIRFSYLDKNKNTE